MKQMIGGKIGYKLHKDRDEILAFCASYKRIHLYGMGYVANMMYRYLEEENIKIADVIVGDGCGTTNSFQGKYEVFELSKVFLGAEDGIILSVRAEIQDEIRAGLRKSGIDDTQIYGQRIYAFHSMPKIRESCYIAPYADQSGESFFSQYAELDRLGEVYGTDKCSRGHDYLRKYEFFLDKWRKEEITVLELGVFKGASLNMWGKFFERATVYGVDIDSNCRNYEHENCKVLIGDLGNEDILDELAELEPTIVIDDASHLWSHQIKSLFHLVPALKSGGVFIMEDLGTSFLAYRNMNFDDAIISTYDFCSAVADVVSSGEFLSTNVRNTNIFLLKEEIEYIAAQIEMISFVKESCIMIKR